MKKKIKPKLFAQVMKIHNFSLPFPTFTGCVLHRCWLAALLAALGVLLVVPGRGGAVPAAARGV